MIENTPFYFIDTNKQVTDAWQKAFGDVKNVIVKNESIFNSPCDVIVSPANSFGYMNGGIDFAISKTLGWHIEKKLQKTIRDKYFGELLVGQATVVDTGNTSFPYLIAAPTMRTLMTILKTPNIYLCMKAILVLLKYGKFEDGEPISNKIKSVAIPGLGTGIGQAPPLFSAICMRIAWEDVMKEKFVTEKDWEEIGSNYAYFFTHDVRDIKYNIPFQM
jgi:O-acetyl-ADP-ribose deacetylase (regulator of RNase III)